MSTIAAPDQDLPAVSTPTPAVRPVRRRVLSATLRLVLWGAGGVALLVAIAYALYSNPAETVQARASARSLLVSALDTG